ncbi:MAG: LacI family DNA-binding transcriptional regulator [Pseudomonadota bacterium]
MALAKKRVTLKEVAERAGVSRSAVSRTFTPGASVSDETRRRVENAAEALGYSPSVLASGLSTGRTKLIGLVSNNFRNPFYLEVFDAFTRTLQSRDLRPLLVNLSEQFDADDALAMLRQYSVDGVVVASSTLPPAFSSAFSDAGLPVVHAFARHSEIPDVNTVGIDNVACGRMAADLLMARGYGQVGFLGGPQTAASTADRQAGFLDALPAGVRAKCPVYHANDYSFQAGYAAMADIIARGVSRRAWFCGDDAISIGAKAALEASAKSVPQDVGIVGVNGMDIAAWQGIELTTFRQPLQAIVDAVVERLAQLMEDPDDAPRAIRFEPQLIDGATLRQRPKNG